MTILIIVLLILLLGGGGVAVNRGVEFPGYAAPFGGIIGLVLVILLVLFLLGHL